MAVILSYRLLWTKTRLVAAVYGVWVAAWVLDH
jgi:hypothetical protein